MATAFASNVFPVPGGPKRRTPLRGFSPAISRHGPNDVWKRRYLRQRDQDEVRGAEWYPVCPSWHPPGHQCPPTLQRESKFRGMMKKEDKLTLALLRLPVACRAWRATVKSNISTTTPRSSKRSSTDESRVIAWSCAFRKSARRSLREKEDVVCARDSIDTSLPMERELPEPFSVLAKPWRTASLCAKLGSFGMRKKDELITENGGDLN